jgi:hypothetical protein
MMRIIAATSPQERVRVAVVVAGRMYAALASLSSKDLHAAGVGVMPFPGLDRGDGLLLALRRRLPVLTAFGFRRPGPGPAVRLPRQLDLVSEPRLDRALAIIVARLLIGAASELDRAVRIIGGLIRTLSLQALLLPNSGNNISQLLTEWAHDRELRVGVIQSDPYTLREYGAGDRLADVVLGWGEGAAEQARDWRTPRPTVVPVGIPGISAIPFRTPTLALRRAVIATSHAAESPMDPAGSPGAFMEAVIPGLQRLAAAGVKLELRHLGENPECYVRMLHAHGLDVRAICGASLSVSVIGADLLISSMSSVAFEAAALGAPILVWLGPAPKSIREEHLVDPWARSGIPGTFDTADDLLALIDDLVERPARGFQVAYTLSRELAHYAQPFDKARFAAALLDLGS